MDINAQRQAIGSLHLQYNTTQNQRSKQEIEIGIYLVMIMQPLVIISKNSSVRTCQFDVKIHEFHSISFGNLVEQRQTAHSIALTRLPLAISLRKDISLVF